MVSGEDVPFKKTIKNHKRPTRSSLMAKLSAWALSVISLSGKRDLAVDMGQPCDLYWKMRENRGKL